MFKFDSESLVREAPRVALIGVGGGGCKAVTRLHDVLSDLVTVAINTDAVSLKAARAMTKVRIGLESTEGAGTGGDADLGRMAAENDVEMLRGLFSNVDVAIVAVALGGGTGSGATPVLVRTAEESDTLVIVVATMPFAFESAARRALAERACEDLRNRADILVRIDNDRVVESVGNAKVAEAFEAGARMLARGIAAFARMLAMPSLLTIDIGDLRRVCSGGICLFGIASASGNGRASAVVEQLVRSPMLDRGKALREAPCAVLSIAAASDLAVTEVDAIVRDMSAGMAKDCDMIVGITVDDRWDGDLVVSVLAGTRVKRALPAGPRETVSEPAPRKGRRRAKARDMQAKLRLDVVGKGRFKDVEATILDGEDLDTPTYVRRGLDIER